MKKLKTRNIPLSIDAELLAEVDAVAEAMRESRSLVMRQAMRLGLPGIKIKMREQIGHVFLRAGEGKP